MTDHCDPHCPDDRATLYALVPLEVYLAGEESA